MNYYPFHLGDYAAHTGHLEPLEDLAYRRMLDAYYLRESPLPCDPVEIARLIRMRPHQTEVEAILHEFFYASNEGWRHQRCDEEIERMQDKQAKARASAAASVSARKAKAERTPDDGEANAQRTLSERSATVTRIEPVIRTKAGASKPDDVDEAVWHDFVTHRKQKKSPITKTALDGIRREADKAGWDMTTALSECCSRGWTGFKAEWVADRQHTPINRQDALEHRNRAVANAWAAQGA